MSNPFSYGNPVSPDQFIGRRRELRRIVGRIANQGQSTAVVGEPRSGKTSLLLYLAAPEMRAKLYGESVERLLFSYLDAQTLGGEFSQAQFWEYVLRPLHERVVAPSPDSPLAQAYQMCQENDFGCFVLERLFAQMEPTGWRLVLVLDEFDVLLHHPILNSGEFFGSQRSLASRSRGALTLIIASRRPLTDLNKDTQQLSRTGSPYFNFFSEVTLGSLPNKDITELLGRAGDRFTTEDRRFIVEVAGGHPYLLQVAASALWEVYEEGEDDPNQRRQQTGENLYEEAASTLSNIWQFWSPATQKAFTAIALAHISSLTLGNREFRVERLAHDLSDLRPELRALQKQGFIMENSAISSGWQIRPVVFLWWVADEVVRVARDDTPFDKWLLAQLWEGSLTRGEKQQLDKVIHAIGGKLRDGAAPLIQAAAKGAAEGAAKAMVGGE